jgi:hypothetical protein
MFFARSPETMIVGCFDYFRRAAFRSIVVVTAKYMQSEK